MLCIQCQGPAILDPDPSRISRIASNKCLQGNPCWHLPQRTAQQPTCRRAMLFSTLLHHLPPPHTPVPRLCCTARAATWTHFFLAFFFAAAFFAFFRAISLAFLYARHAA